MCCWYIWELLCTGSAARVPELHSQPVVSAPSALLIDLRVFSTGIVLNLHSMSRAGLGISKHIGRSLPGSFEIWFGCFPSLQPNDWFPLFCVCLTCSFVLVFPPLPLSYFFCSSFAAPPRCFFWGWLGDWEGSSKLAHRWIMHLKHERAGSWGWVYLSVTLFFLYYSHVGTRLLPQSRKWCRCFPVCISLFWLTLICCRFVCQWSPCTVLVMQLLILDVCSWFFCFFVISNRDIYVGFVQVGFNWTLCQKCVFAHFVHFLLLQNTDRIYEHRLKLAPSVKKWGGT